MLEREHRARAAEARLHLVDAEERPVLPTERLRAFEIAGRRQMHALPLDRLDEEQRNVFALQLLFECIEVSERHALEAGKERPEPRGELGVAVRRERTERQAVEAVVDREHARAFRRCAAELERRLDRLGAGAREEHPLEPGRRACQQRLGEESRQRGDAELHGAGRVELERLDQRRPNARVVAADVVHPEAAEHVEIAGAVRVVEVGAVRARPRAVEADRAQDADELRVDRARPARVLIAGTGEQALEVDRAHAPEFTRSRRESRARDPRSARRAASAERRSSASTAGLSPEASAVISVMPAARASVISSAASADPMPRC